MNRTALRVLTGLAAVAVASVCLLGTAHADDRSVDARAWGMSTTLAANEPLVAAVGDARDDLRAAVLAARAAWRAAMAGIREEVLAEAASARAGGADARTALDQAWARHRDQVDTATAAAKSSLLTARAAYVSAVSAAFGRHAPTSTVPRGLLEPAWWPAAGDGLWGRDAERPRG